MEHQKYSTSKSKTFSKECYAGDLIEWVANNIQRDPERPMKPKEKYKITIVNLNE